jgi:hypothetical protein
VILKEARAWLAQPERDYQHIVIIVDELEKLPVRESSGSKSTNHEELFLDNVHILRSLECHVLYTVPVALAYGSKRTNLQNAYGDSIMTLPVIPVRERSGNEFEPGIAALTSVIEKRLKRAGVSISQFVAEEASIRELCLACGGHLRYLFRLIRSALNRLGTRGLPLSAEDIDASIVRLAADESFNVEADFWQVLDEVHQTKQACTSKATIWNELLSGLRVFTYEDDKGFWYDWNPLLGYVAPERRSR